MIEQAMQIILRALLYKTKKEYPKALDEIRTGGTRLIGLEWDVFVRLGDDAMIESLRRWAEVDRRVFAVAAGLLDTESEVLGLQGREDEAWRRRVSAFSLYCEALKGIDTTEVREKAAAALEAVDAFELPREIEEKRKWFLETNNARYFMQFANREGDQLMTLFEKPLEGEYIPYTIQYISLLPDRCDLPALLEEHLASALAILRSAPEEKLTWRYAPGKWTIKEILLHIIDTERVLAYRALWLARKDGTPLPGFEQDDWVANSNANTRSIDDLLEELTAVRRASITLLKSFDAEVLTRKGTANGKPMTVRAVSFILAGHLLHHMNIITERYL
ncbi:MAG TPA: DinB family protein [Bacteroidota bacterium]|nr:DinB family protein [Bacteroidota bacterium]